MAGREQERAGRRRIKKAEPAVRKALQRVIREHHIGIARKVVLDGRANFRVTPDIDFNELRALAGAFLVKMKATP